MKNPASVLDVNPHIQALISPIYQSGISLELLEYISLRVGQMNNCELCIGQSFVRAETNPDIQSRIDHVLEWRKSTAFNEAEQTALEIAESITELEDKYNSVSDSLWSKFEDHYTERERAALVLLISVMNMFTRINIATKQVTANWD